MSKFKEIALTLLEEYDRNDPTDNFWQAAREYKQQQFSQAVEKNKLYSKKIEPVQADEWVYIKSICRIINGICDPLVMYLTGNKDRPYTAYKEKAKKFRSADAIKFVDNHPKTTFKLGSDPRDYEKHFEIEKI